MLAGPAASLIVAFLLVKRYICWLMPTTGFMSFTKKRKKKSPTDRSVSVRNVFCGCQQDGISADLSEA